MNERERLIEILKNAKKYAANTMLHLDIDEAIDVSYDSLKADYLLENGVVMLPCKCDKCSHRCNNTNECGIYGRICTENGYCDKALKGGSKNE